MKNLHSSKKGGLQVFYRPDTADEEVLHHSFDRDIFYRAVPEYKLENGHTVLDIGAHIGVFSLFTAINNPQGRIFAIEPCGDTYAVLEKNISENALQQVTSYKLALSGEKGTSKLYYDIKTGNWGHSITHQFSEEGEMVPTDTLDNFFEQQQIDRCHFIKFNCEGSEFSILMNASSQTLKKVDKMLVLYHMDLFKDIHIDEVIRRLKQAGFYCEKRMVSKQGQRGWLVAFQATGGQRVVYTLKYLAKWPMVKAKKAIKKLLGMLRTA